MAPPEPLVCVTPALSPPSGDFIDIPAKSIFDRISEPLAATARRIFGSEGRILIPLNLVLPQLSQGCVKITFGELKRSAPAAHFLDAGEHDQVPIQVPLPEILSKLRPSQLSRRAGQRKVEVPDELPSLFNPKRPPTLPSDNGPASPMLPVPAVCIAEANEENGDALQRNAPSDLTLESQIIAVSSQETAQTSVPENVLSVTLNSVADSWPEAVRLELSHIRLSSAVLLLPLEELEIALKRGKAVFPWKQIRTWIQPRLDPGRGMATEDVSVELPLNVLAPRFLARRKPAPSRVPRYEVADSIPRLFGPAHAIPSQSADHPQLANLPSIRNTEAKGGNDAGHLGHLFGQPAKRSWTVTEIVEQTAKLNGVTGALLVTLDGLLIAACLPTEMVADTLAAFVPQMFLRVVQYAKELKFGEPSHVTFFIEETPLQIYRTGCVYLALVGRSGESLPTEQLKAIAAALPRPALDPCE